MWREHGPNIQFIKLVEILDFDGLVFKCCFYVKWDFECCGLRFEWYCMMKIVWKWIHTFGIMYGVMFVCVLNIDGNVVTKISELH